MRTAGIRIMAAVAGLAAAVGAPAAAQVGEADAQAIARSLAEQGYSDVRIDREDGGLVVSATREGETHSFAYDRDEGRLEPRESDDGPEDEGPDDDGGEDEGRDGPGDEGRGGAEGGGRGGDGGQDGSEGRGGDDGRGGEGGQGGGDEGGGGEED